MPQDDLFGYIWNGLLTFFLGVAGWFVRDAIDTGRRMRADHEAHKLEVAREYVTKADLLRSQDETQRKLDALKDAMDRMSDKFDRFTERQGR